MLIGIVNLTDRVGQLVMFMVHVLVVVWCFWHGRGYPHLLLLGVRITCLVSVGGTVICISTSWMRFVVRLAAYMADSVY